MGKCVPVRRVLKRSVMSVELCDFLLSVPIKIVTESQLKLQPFDRLNTLNKLVKIR